jgi:hypothetical protein
LDAGYWMWQDDSALQLANLAAMLALVPLTA